MDNKITSSRNFTIKNGNTLPNTLKQTCHSNNRQTNNMSNTEIKRVPPECTIQFGMQPLQKQAEIIEIYKNKINKIGEKSVYAVQKLLKNENYKKIPFIKSILKNNKTQLEKTFSNGKQTADGDFLLFATGHKPGFLVCSFFQPDITFLPDNYKAIGDSIILNKEKTKEVIKDNFEWLKLLLNDENIENEEDIYNCVINSDLEQNPLYKKENAEGIPTMKDALIGIFLGYPPISSIIFDLTVSQNKGEDPENKLEKNLNKNEFIELLESGYITKLKNKPKLKDKLIKTLKEYPDDFIKDETTDAIQYAMFNKLDLTIKNTLYGERFANTVFTNTVDDINILVPFYCTSYIHEPKAEKRIIEELDNFAKDVDTYYQ